MRNKLAALVLAIAACLPVQPGVASALPEPPPSSCDVPPCGGDNMHWTGPPINV